jgi:hypothetical protein
MQPQKILGQLDSNYPLEYTPENFLTAQAFVMNKWLERFNEKKQSWEKLGGEYGEKSPLDLSGSCKFSSLFAASVFGGEVQGNEYHQYCVIDKLIIDLNKDAKDVNDLEDPYYHDDGFFGSRDHMASMKFCKERVNAWLKEFPSYLNPKVIPKPKI